MSKIVSIALLALAFVIIIGLFSLLFARTEDKAAEEICHTMNAIVYRGGLDAAKTAGLLPNACQVLEKEDVPEGKYGSGKQGAMNQIAEMSSKCWWMFLEGVEGHDVLGSKIFGGKDCFICYTFDLANGVAFSAAELDNYFDTASYTVKDASDKCAPLGGGYCVSKCEGTYPKEVASNKCEEPGEKCCVAENNNDECLNKGGRCLPGCTGEYTQEYASWRCSSNTCCIKPANHFTFRDYIQRFKGPGSLSVDAGVNFDDSGIYAVVFTEDTSIIGSGVETADGIWITELNKVNKKCSIESGALG